jgi:hypothetical protein
MGVAVRIIVRSGSGLQWRGDTSGREQNFPDTGGCSVPLHTTVAHQNPHGWDSGQPFGHDIAPPRIVHTNEMGPLTADPILDEGLAGSGVFGVEGVQSLDGRARRFFLSSCPQTFLVLVRNFFGKRHFLCICLIYLFLIM